MYMESETGLVPKATVEAIVCRREETLQLFRSALIQFRQANQAFHDASPGHYVSLHIERSYPFGHHSDKIDETMECIRKQVDRAIWRHLIDATGFCNFMDTKAMEEFHDNLENPPDVTLANIHDTLTGLHLQRGPVFRRGLVNIFLGFSGRWARQFKSNSPVKIGKRIVLTRAVDTYFVSRKSELSDLDRIFHVLDKKPAPEHGGDLADLISLACHQKTGTMVETEYFKVRWFQNGNAHVYFLREDLVELANKLIADELGPALGECA